MGSETYHEALELISEETKNMHRAIVSLMEELEAIDWYQQRADACSDDALREVLIHNKNEEVEHAMMNLEWIRRNNAVFDANARTYLFSSVPITEAEEAATGGGGADAPDPAKATPAKADAGNPPDVSESSKSPTRGGGSTSPARGSSDGSLGIGSLRG